MANLRLVSEFDYLIASDRLRHLISIIFDSSDNEYFV